MLVGIGVDIVEIERIGRILSENRNMIHRLFTAEEIEYCSNRKKSYQHFAVRFAAKEAALKALGVGWSDGIHWTDVEVVNRQSGQPELRLSGRAQEIFEAAGACRSLVTLSHGENYAVAMVAFET